MAITLTDILTQSPEKIIENANQMNLDSLISEEDKFIEIEIKDYRGLLPREEIVIGKEFILRNYLSVRINNISINNNKVELIFPKFPCSKAYINLYKLSSESITPHGFPYEIGQEYYYTKKGSEKLIVISQLNPSQRAIGFIDENGKKKFVKIKKLRPKDD